MGSYISHALDQAHICICDNNVSVPVVHKKCRSAIKYRQHDQGSHPKKVRRGAVLQESYMGHKHYHFHFFIYYDKYACL